MCFKFDFQFVLIVVSVLVLTMLPLTAGPTCDRDNDGFKKMSKNCGGDDCNDSDASVNPGADELCNGVDDNCNGVVDEGIPGCGSGGIGWTCLTDFSAGTLDWCEGDGLGCVPGDPSGPDDPLDRTDADCHGVLYLGAGGGEPRFEFSCMVRTEYNGYITPFVTTGKDQCCGEDDPACAKDDPFMMRLGKHLQIDDPVFPTHLIGEEYNRLASKSPDRLYQTYQSYSYLSAETPDGIMIREDDGNGNLVPITFTLPARCHEPFYCFQGKQCKDSTDPWGTYSHTELTCTPE